MNEPAVSASPGIGPLVLVGVIAGLFSGFLGVGGGIVMVPFMVSPLLRFDQHRAHATSLAAIVVIALSAGTRFALAGEIDWAVGIALGVGGIVGSTVGANLMHRLSPSALKLLFGVIMILAGLRMVVGVEPGAGQAPEAMVAALIGVTIGLVAGVASGLAGIGGGVVMVPAMVLLLGLSQHAAEGTSLVAILFTALAGTRVNLKHGRVRLREAVIIGLGGLLFAPLGASLALAVSAPALSQVFGIFVTLVGLRMVTLLYLARRRRAPEAI